MVPRDVITPRDESSPADVTLPPPPDAGRAANTTCATATTVARSVVSLEVSRKSVLQTKLPQAKLARYLGPTSGVVLTDDGRLQHQLSDPRHKQPKTYWAQVEGIPDAAAIARLAAGVVLRDGPTAPAQARVIAPPSLWPRDPPIRFRAAIPTAWIELVLHEGRNRQVRRMTAAVGFPTLRLVRWSVGRWNLEGLGPGAWRSLQA